MDKTNQEAAAHAIAQIFCDHHYGEIAWDAKKKWDSSGRKGDPAVLIARELWSKYLIVYEEVIKAAAQEPEL